MYVKDVIPGINDADDPVIMMIFLDDVLQDGYTTLGIPDFTMTNRHAARGLIFGGIFCATGERIASVAQEALIRIPRGG